jgi:hypothetical protein
VPLFAALEQAGQPRHADRGRQPIAEERAGLAVELAAARAVEGGGLVAGDTAEVPLHLQLAVGGRLDLAIDGVELARPQRTLGRRRGHADAHGRIGGDGSAQDESQHERESPQ